MRFIEFQNVDEVLQVFIPELLVDAFLCLMAIRCKLDRLVEDFRTGRSTYDLARRGVRASLSERRQSPLLRTLHAMALRRLEVLREGA